MKAIVFLTATSLASNGPRVDHPGASGAGYPYLYNAKYGKHILYGRELGPEELDKVSADVFGAERSHRIPTPRLVPDDVSEPAKETLKDIATVDNLFARACEMPVEKRRRLGWKLTNATRPPRKKKKPVK